MWRTTCHPRLGGCLPKGRWGRQNTVPAVFILAKLALDVLYAFCKFVLSDEAYDVSDSEAA